MTIKGETISINGQLLIIKGVVSIMTASESKNIRNIALVGHGGTGKTSLLEALLFNAGHNTRLGRVDDGTAMLDFDPDEIKRKVTIHLALAPVETGHVKVNFLDTPGFADFVGEVHRSLVVADGVVFLLDGGAGVEVQTEIIWELVKTKELPRAVFVNKLDKEHSDFQKALTSLNEYFKASFVPMHLPIGKDSSFSGVVDLMELKAYTYKDGKAQAMDIPEDMQSTVAEYREKLVEAAAETDEDLTMKYLEGEELTSEEIISGLRLAFKSGSFVPVMCGCAHANIGVDLFLKFAVDVFPTAAESVLQPGVHPDSGEEIKLKPSADEPFSGYVFKTFSEAHVGDITYMKVLSGKISSGSSAFNSTKDLTEKLGQLFMLRGKSRIDVTEAVAGDIVGLVKLKNTGTSDTLCVSSSPVKYPPIEFPLPSIFVAVSPKSKADQEKLGSGLSRIAEEDPTFGMKLEPELRQTIIFGMGELHLEVMMERLKRRSGVELEVWKPRIGYRETCRAKAQTEYKYKKQTGGRGQYGHCYLDFAPLPAGSGFEFDNRIVGGVIPTKYIPAVEKGIREAMSDGVLAGYPVIDVKVGVYDGSFHAVDSSDMAFKIAASHCFKKGFMEAKPILLEPIQEVEIRVPETFMGDVMGDLNSRRGRILGMEGSGKTQIIKAHVPLAEMYKYINTLKSITQGRGTFTMMFYTYEEVPANVAQQIIEEAKQAKEAMNE